MRRLFTVPAMEGQGMKRLAFCLLLPAALAAQAPAALLGTWHDDYGATHQITDTLWIQGPNQFRIVHWDNAGRFLVARNAATNAGQAGRWSRIDVMRFEAMPPWRWGYCFSAWDAPSADSAARVAPADRSAPRTGCGGFPFTRMRAPPE